MAFETLISAIGAAGGDPIALFGDFDITATYQAALVGTDDSIGPVLSADTQLSASVAPGFSGALPVGGVDLAYFAPQGRLVIDPHKPQAESAAYIKAGNTLVIAQALTQSHAGGADVRMVVSGLDGVPPFTAPLTSGVGGSQQVVSPLSPTSMVVFAPALVPADTVAYTFLRQITLVNEQPVAGPVTSTQSVRAFRVQITSLVDGSIVQSDNTLSLYAPFLSASVYDMRRYLSNYAVGARGADQEGGIWGQ